MLTLTRSPDPPEFPLMELFAEMFRRHAGTDLSPVRFLSLQDDREIVYNRRWRPSGLRYCQRKQVYAAYGCKQLGERVDVSDQFNLFDRGHVYGAWIGAYFRAMESVGLITDVHTQAAGGPLEMVCRAPELKLAGKADVAFTYQGFEYMVEVKSKDNVQRFHALTKPDKNHVEQLNDYLGMTGRKAGWVLYIGPEPAKDKAEGNTTISLKPFFHRFNPQMWAQTVGTCKMLDLYYDAPNLLAPKTTDTWFQCSQCAWRYYCDRDIPPAKAEKA